MLCVLSLLGSFTITTQPSNIFTRRGAVASFECVAVGSTNIVYQWLKLSNTLDEMQGGAAGSGSGSGDRLIGYVDVENATDSILDFNPVMFGDEGTYRCFVSSESGTLTSNVALLTGMWKHLKSYINTAES